MTTEQEEGINPLATLPEDLLEDYAYLSFKLKNNDTTKDISLGVGNYGYTHPAGDLITYYLWYYSSENENNYQYSSTRTTSGKSSWNKMSSRGAVAINTANSSDYSFDFTLYDFVSSMPIDVLFEDVTTGVVGEDYIIKPNDGSSRIHIDLPHPDEYTGLPFHGVLQCTEGVGETSYIPTSTTQLDVPLVLDAEYDSDKYYGTGSGRVWYI